MVTTTSCRIFFWKAQAACRPLTSFRDTREDDTLGQRKYVTPNRGFISILRDPMRRQCNCKVRSACESCQCQAKLQDIFHASRSPCLGILGSVEHIRFGTSAQTLLSLRIRSSVYEYSDGFQEGPWDGLSKEAGTGQCHMRRKSMKASLTACRSTLSHYLLSSWHRRGSRAVCRLVRMRSPKSFGTQSLPSPCVNILYDRLQRRQYKRRNA